MVTILAAASGPFREGTHERLLAAGRSAIAVVQSATELTEVLRDAAADALVVTGGDWPDSRPFLHAALQAGTPVMVLLNLPTLEAEQAVLAQGAHAALDAGLHPDALSAALGAVQTGLVVLDQHPALPPSAFDADPLGARKATAARRTPKAVPSNPSARRQFRPLSPREREILSLVASGTSNKGIARALAVSANTVKFHLATAFDKLDVATRAEAVAEAIRRGELSL